jgi:hypothetical protein
MFSFAMRSAARFFTSSRRVPLTVVVLSGIGDMGCCLGEPVGSWEKGCRWISRLAAGTTRLRGVLGIPELAYPALDPVTPPLGVTQRPGGCPKSAVVVEGHHLGLPWPGQSAWSGTALFGALTADEEIIEALGCLLDFLVEVRDVAHAVTSRSTMSRTTSASQSGHMAARVRKNMVTTLCRSRTHGR